MNNILTTISFSIFSNKGIYALLLGSGISKNSGIPTGWDIVVNLIKKLAAINKEDCSENPEKWFFDKYQEEANYSKILFKLSKSPEERMNLLKQYFEPTEDEIEQGLKQPTETHKYIAKLIKKGYIKVVLTTNFDRLLEKALESEGIAPIVISHPDDIDGVLPLVHTDIVIIKINGDYMDSRCLNTKEELSNYEKKLNDYILRIINEFGIISCGWSGKWDIGLAFCIKQCENFRFFNYWTYVGQCEEALNDIARRRKGEVVKIKSSDAFFREINDNIDALETFNQNNPLTTDIAVARLKKYIVRDEYRIYLYDLIQYQLKEALEKIRSKNDEKSIINNEYIRTILTSTIHSMETILHLIINGVYWARKEQYEVFVDVLKSISTSKLYGELQCYFRSINAELLIYFPSLLTIYAIGLTALKRDNYAIINQCFNMKIIEFDYYEEVFLINEVNSCMVDRKIMNSILGKSFKTPLSTYLNEILEPIFVKYFYNDKEFQEKFDLFEYLLSLNYTYLVGSKSKYNWSPYGEYRWNSNWKNGKKSLITNFIEGVKKDKDKWNPLRSGMFDGKYQVFEDTKNKLEFFLESVD